jgi:hypothetical protein
MKYFTHTYFGIAFILGLGYISKQYIDSKNNFPKFRNIETTDSIIFNIKNQKLETS